MILILLKMKKKVPQKDAEDDQTTSYRVINMDWPYYST